MFLESEHRAVKEKAQIEKQRRTEALGLFAQPPAQEAGHGGRGHALCSASGSERWLNCPGSIRMSVTAPDEPPSKYAIEGTRAHELAERILKECEKEKWARIPQEFVDALRPEYLDTIDPDAKVQGVGSWGMVDYVLTYVAFCLEEIATFDPPTDGRRGPVVRIEQRLTYSEDMKMFGTVDFFVTGFKQGKACGTIIDLKYGKGKKVKTAGNSQLAYYAVALWKCSTLKLEEVNVRIVQPRIDDFFQDVFYTVAELREWAKTLTLGAEKAMMLFTVSEEKLRASLKCGPWCYFCPSRRDCPAKDKEAAARAAEEFAGVVA